MMTQIRSDRATGVPRELPEPQAIDLSGIERSTLPWLPIGARTYLGETHIEVDIKEIAAFPLGLAKDAANVINGLAARGLLEVVTVEHPRAYDWHETEEHIRLTPAALRIVRSLREAIEYPEARP